MAHSRTRWAACRIGLLIAVAVLSAPPCELAAQTDEGVITAERLAEVFPGVDRFGPRGGDPPVYEAFTTDPSGGEERLVGYVFLTSDLPPEVYGYSAPIDVLVGMDLEGRLTGIQVAGYRESLRRSRGDFLDRSGYLRQFTGKHVSEAFRVREDIDGISGATITVDAMSRGIRNAARRIAAAYLSREPEDASELYIATVDRDALESMLWAEMLDRNLAAQVVLLDGAVRITLAMVYLPERGLGEMLVGPAYFEEGLAELEARGALPDLRPDTPSRLMLMGLSGEDSFFFRASALAFVQGADTLAVPGENIEMLPILREGKLQGEVRRSGIVVLDPALDLSRPFEIVLDFSPRGGTAATRYVVWPPETPPALDAPALLAEAVPTDAPGDASEIEGTDPDAETTRGAGLDPGPEAVGPADPDDPTPVPGRAAESTAPADAGTTTPTPGSGLDYDFDALLDGVEEEAETSALARVLSRTSWTRVAGFVLLLGLATAAFAFKRASLRWATLAIVLVGLGFYDGGFLSVSHIMAGISVGPSVYLGDIPLLLLVVFTLLTTLLWGRVFCGFLCPFGALQDLLERVVPARWRRELPQAVHDRALWVKYGILALVLAPAVVGSGLSLFQYFEPFGTVFYRSSSLVLWGIAGLILVASAIVPRFYCRYACPLGAALAIGALVSPFRIRRVEQCTLCKVCEQRCPTGAIRGAAIDFKECVRCNACEIQLIERNGVCAHDMDRIRPRLVRLPVAGRSGAVAATHLDVRAPVSGDV